jgi:hypothetical protein
MWICSKCGVRVEPAFDVCWRCGTSYQGEEDPDFVTADEAPPIDDPTSYLQLDEGKPKLCEDELPGPPLELVVCFESNVLAEVKFVADQLQAEGIPATLQNVHGGGVGMPMGTYTLYPSCIVVRAEDLPRARAWVKGYKGRRIARARQDD